MSALDSSYSTGRPGNRERKSPFDREGNISGRIISTLTLVYLGSRMENWKTILFRPAGVYAHQVKGKAQILVINERRIECFDIIIESVSFTQR